MKSPRGSEAPQVLIDAGKVDFEAVKKPSEFPSCKIKSLPWARGMSQENPLSK
jgi:hypothetical protein